MSSAYFMAHLLRRVLSHLRRTSASKRDSTAMLAHGGTRGPREASVAGRLGDGVADADGPVAQDVGVDPGPMRELPHDPRAGEALQVGARLAQLDAVAEHVADQEAPPDEVVQAHPADRDLPARRPGRQVGAHDDLVLDERDRLPRAGSVRVEVPVALEALAGESAYRVDRVQRLALDRPDVDGDDRWLLHAAMICAAEAARPSGSGTRRSRASRIAAERGGGTI